MIELHDVYKSYRPDAEPALNGVSLQIAAGECAVLIGPSGCGKSTLIKTINRMTAIDRGDVIVRGRPVQDYPLEELRLHTGYCIQGVGLFPHFSVRENIGLIPGLLKWPPEKVEQRVRDLMDLTGLPLAYLDKKPRELSGGEAQRVGVCRALAADPPVLLMDEPFGSVDPLNRERLQLIFVRLQRELKKTVLFVTHDVEEALMIGDTIFIMNQGRIEASGTPGHFAGPLEQGFAKSFLGSEYPLKILRKYSVKDLRLAAEPACPADLADAEAALAADGPDALPMSEDLNLKQVLAEMLRRNQQTLCLRDTDGGRLVIRYADLVRHLQEVSGL
jgi:osmoprotectant transport system ATP-binding protein